MNYYLKLIRSIAFAYLCSQLCAPSVYSNQEDSRVWGDALVGFDGNVDTGFALGWLYFPSAGNWAWVYRLNQWAYSPDPGVGFSGVWVYVRKSGNGSTDDHLAPEVPAGLALESVSAFEVELSWTDSNDNVAVTGYRIFRDGVEVGTTAETSYTDRGLSPSTGYRYTVSAYDAAANESDQSSALDVITDEESGSDDVVFGLIFNDPIDIIGTLTGGPNFRNGIAILPPELQTTNTGLVALATDPNQTYCQLSAENDTNDNTIWPNKDEFRFELKTYIPSTESASGYTFFKYAGLSHNPVYDTEDGFVVNRTGADNVIMRWFSEQKGSFVDFSTKFLKLPKDEYITLVMNVSIGGNLIFDQTMRIDVYDSNGDWVVSSGTTSPIESWLALAAHGLSSNDTSVAYEGYNRSLLGYHRLETSWDIRNNVSIIALQAMTAPGNVYQTINSIVGEGTGIRITDILDVNGNSTGMRYEIETTTSTRTDGWNKQGQDIADFVSEGIIFKESHYNASCTSKASHLITGADPNGVYRIVLTGSRGGTNIDSTYVVQGVSQSISTNWNNANGAVFLNVIPTESGVIDIQFCGILSAIEIEKLD